jgi:hypothetical protein
MLILAYGGEGTELIMSAHGFMMYDLTGRWAGCRVIKVPEKNLTADVDALGSSAYFDGAGRESVNRCHRSASAAIHIDDTPSLNLACSGAITSFQIVSHVLQLKQQDLMAARKVLQMFMHVF